MKEYPETHQKGTISLENMPEEFKSGRGFMQGDFGIQIAGDGRAWVCIDGIAFIRFKPHPNGKIGKTRRDDVKPF